MCHAAQVGVVALIDEVFNRIVNIFNFDFIVTAMKDDMLVGCATITLYEQYENIQCFCVTIQERSNNIGRNLLDYIKTVVASKQLVLHVDQGPWHDRLVKFYKSQGFRIFLKNQKETGLCT